MNKNKESLNGINQNQIRLTILEKQAQRYREFLETLRLRKQNNEEKKFQFNSDFLKNQQKEKEEIELKPNEEKPLFISKKIEKLKNISLEIKDKVTDIQNSKTNKNELFKHLQEEIEHFSSMIEYLQVENRQLKQELELLLEKSQKESKKLNFEKENSSLKEKIESIKNKTPFDEDFTEKKLQKINKISYEKTNEMEN